MKKKLKIIENHNKKLCVQHQKTPRFKIFIFKYIIYIKVSQIPKSSTAMYCASLTLWSTGKLCVKSLV